MQTGKSLFFIIIVAFTAISAGCSAKKNHSSADSLIQPENSLHVSAVPDFNSDSAYAFVKKQVEFGPRVPNTPAHDEAARWIFSKLTGYAAEVHQQAFDIPAFDGSILHARNIFARFNSDIKEHRLLLIAHYDTRPWADNDPDPAKRRLPGDGANDGASGVAVLLETARNLAANNPQRGIDLLFTDAEDYGSNNYEDSWALGAEYFARSMRENGWQPENAVLLDMVGGKDAIFPYEYFSRQAAPELDRAFRNAATNAGYSHLFPDFPGGAVTDDHLAFIKEGVPAIDIIEYDPESGFNTTWHTHADNLDNISRETLKGVGQALLNFIYQ